MKNELTIEQLKDVLHIEYYKSLIDKAIEALYKRKKYLGP
jgi:hypothetical protein